MSIRFFKMVTLFICLASVSNVFGQSLTRFKIVVIDSANSILVSTAKINVSDQNGKIKLDSYVNSNGILESKLPAGTYGFEISAVGYSTKKVVYVIPAADSLVKLSSVSLSRRVIILSDVTINSARPVIKTTIEGLNYDVGADPDNASSNLLDIMKKVPLLSLNAEEKVLMKGSTDFKFYINGRPSQALQGDAKNVLRSMAAGTIKRIEVISHPSSRYDAEGVSGIINIVTKSNPNNGYSGSLGASYSYPYGLGFNGSATFRFGKFAISENAGYGNQHKPPLSTGNSQRSKDGRTSVGQLGSKTSQGYFAFSTTDLSYDIDTLNLLTASFTRFQSPSHNKVMLGTDLSSDNFLGNQSYHQNNNEDAKLGNNSWGVNYQRKFKKNSEATFTVSYNLLQIKNSQDNTILFDSQHGSELTDYTLKNRYGVDEHTGQIDMVYPLKKWSVEGGIKGIFRRNFSDYQQNTLFNGAPTFDPINSNVFSYLQNVLSAYNSYNFKLFTINIKAGARIERTIDKANFKSSGGTLDLGYNNLLPSVIFQKTYEKVGDFNLSYNQRIERPAIWQLNPFIDKSNNLFVSTGNAELRAATYHNIDLTYSKFGKLSSFTTDIFYNFTVRGIQDIATAINDTLTILRPTNSGQIKTWGNSLNYSFSKGRFRMNFNVQNSYVWFSGFDNTLPISNRGFQGNAFLYMGYKLSDSYRMALNLG